MRYNKLVRDKIPEIIKQDGKNATIHIADEREYAKKLEEKLQEEVNEFLLAKSEEELADVLEVLDAIAIFRTLNKQKIEDIKKKKLEERGGFSKRIILEEVD